MGEITMAWAIGEHGRSQSGKSELYYNSTFLVAIANNMDFAINAKRKTQTLDLLVFFPGIDVHFNRSQGILYYYITQNNMLLTNQMVLIK